MSITMILKSIATYYKPIKVGHNDDFIAGSVPIRTLGTFESEDHRGCNSKSHPASSTSSPRARNPLPDVMTESEVVSC